MPPKPNKIEAEVRRLSKVDGNKTCADCPEKVPGYVDLTHNVFVCTKCSGIHREFQFKVKGVSMSVFNEEDVAGLSSMGNDAFNAVYLARLNTREYPVPNGNDTNKLKDFIRQKYIDKKWHRDGSGGIFTGANVPAAATPKDGSSSRLSITLNKTASFGQTNRRASTGSVDVGKKSAVGDISLDLLSLSEPISAPQPQPHSDDPFGSSSAASFDPFGSSAHDPFGDSSAASFDAFGSSGPPAGFDAFGFDSQHHTPSFSTTTIGAAPITNLVAHHPTASAHAPTPAPAPAPAGSTMSASQNKFSAFDDLAVLSVSSSTSNQGHQNNPFDASGYHPTQAAYPAPNAFGGNVAYPGGPGIGTVASAFPQNSFYPNVPPAHVHQQQYGAPQQQMSQYGAPPQPYGAHGAQHSPVSLYGAPQQQFGAPQQLGYPPAYPQGQPPFHIVAPHAPVATPTQPDPFADMGGLGWGSSAPPASTNYGTPTHGSHGAASVSASASAPSVNPFDLF